MLTASTVNDTNLISLSVIMLNIIEIRRLIGCLSGLMNILNSLCIQHYFLHIFNRKKLAKHYLHI